MVTNTFNEVFASEELTYTQRQGIIILLHKGKDLPRDRLNNWRPITLTNTDYKILANVKRFLSMLIDCFTSLYGRRDFQIEKHVKR